MSQPQQQTLTYPERADAYLARFRQGNAGPPLRSDRQAWAILRMHLDDLALVVRSVRARAMVDGVPARDCLARIGAEARRACEDLGHDLGRFGEMAGPAYLLWRRGSHPRRPAVADVVWAFGLLEGTFAHLAPAIDRIEAAERGLAPVDLGSLNRPEHVRPLDVYLTLFVIAWVASEDLGLVLPYPIPQPEPR